jgi:hypothetical protein
VSSPLDSSHALIQIGFTLLVLLLSHPFAFFRSHLNLETPIVLAVLPLKSR